MDEWLEFLYVMGALNEDDSIGNSKIKDLVYKYNSMFPEYPLEEDFFFDNTQDEQIRKLSDAINEFKPIKNRIR